jgi:hypothetical protein
MGRDCASGPPAKIGRHLGAARCGGRVKASTPAPVTHAGGGGGRLERLAETALGRRSSLLAVPVAPAISWLRPVPS